MPKIKLTKTAVDSATPQERDYELRDTTIPGFLVKVTPAGRKIFMVAYVANNGQRRKPAIGRYGEITVEQARGIAQDWLAEVRRGVDPSAERATARQAPTVKELFDRFITDYSESRNKPSTVESNRGYGKRYIIPALGQLKVPDVTRADISDLMKKMSKKPTNANRVLAAVRKMFNMAEVWGMRPDGSNPCRHVPKFPERGKTRLITDSEMKKLFAYLARAEAEGLEHPFILLAIRLQFEFAARMSEILQLEWSWVDYDNRRVVWPDSKTGGMSKPMSAEAQRLFETAPLLEESPFVCPSVFDPNLPMSKHTYYQGWRRILERAGLPHIGTHGIRHRSATDIANSGIPVKVGMALTAHKTVTMFMKYVHTEDDPVRAAAEAVNQRRQALFGGPATSPPATPVPAPVMEVPSVAPQIEVIEPVLTATGMRAAGQGQAGGLVFGHNSSLSAGNLRATLMSWHETYPEVEVEVVEGERGALLAGLNTGEIDIAILMGATGHEGFRCEPLWSERLHVALPASHELAGREVVHWTDLRSERFMLQAADLGPEIRDILLGRVSLSGATPHILMNQSSRETILSVLSSNSMISIVCECATGVSYPELVYRPMHGEQGPALTAYSAYWRDSNVNPALRRLLRFIKTRYALTFDV